MSEHDRLDPEFLSQARAAFEPSDEARARMKRNIELAVAAAAVTAAVTAAASAGGAGSSSAVGAASVAGAVAKLSLAAKIGLVLLGLTVTGLGVAAMGGVALPSSNATTETDASTSVVGTHVRGGVAADEAALRPPSAMAEPPSLGPVLEEPEPATTGSAPEVSAPRPASRAGAVELAGAVDPHAADSLEADPLARELAWLHESDAALARGDAAGSLRILDRYRSEYPRGMMADERDVRRVLALCAAGRVEDARHAFTDLDDAALVPTQRARLAASCATP
jgi:hypothetical protein